MKIYKLPFIYRNKNKLIAIQIHIHLNPRVQLREMLLSSLNSKVYEILPPHLLNENSLLRNLLISKGNWLFSEIKLTD